MSNSLFIEFYNGGKDWICDKYINFPSTHSVYLRILYPDKDWAKQLASELKNSIINSISNFDANFKLEVLQTEIWPPPLKNNCNPSEVPSMFHYLLVINDPKENHSLSAKISESKIRKLPICKRDENINLPPEVEINNAVFWDNNIEEVIPVIFGIIGIGEEEQQIFISYKRSDTTQLAEQLFDRLSHEGFDVFLDRFSIEPGVNFQERLSQELQDKAMVLILESENYQDSKWIQYEIDFAKQYKLGIFAINTNSAPKVKSVDDELRIYVNTNSSNNLDKNILNDVVTGIKEHHALALFRKKNELQTNILSALVNNMLIPEVDNKGFIKVENETTKNIYKIWSNIRPPQVKDYYFTDTEANNKKVIIGPEFIEGRRRKINNWIVNKSDIKYFHEGNLTGLLNLIKK